MLAAWDHFRCSENCALIVLELMIWEFEVLLQILQKNNNIKSSTTDSFAYLGALGVLKLAPACICPHLWYRKTWGSMYF